LCFLSSFLKRELPLENRPTCATIDTEALRFNYAQLKAGIPETTKMMAVVKANAYGHGDIETARVLEGLGCDCFGVAIPEEGARLRAASIKAPIAVLGSIFPAQIPPLFDFDLTPVIFDINTAHLINGHAKAKAARKKVHVKIDTGMGRLGLLPPDAAGFFKEFKTLESLELEAVLSHFSEAEAPDHGFTERQLALFLDTVREIRQTGVDPGIIEIANSAAAASFPEASLGMVRPGIMLYGSYPAPHLKRAIELRPAMEVRTSVMHVKHLEAGSPISYGRTFVTKRRSSIAVLPIGYADGLPRALSNKGSVLVRGQRAPIAGVVCMDLTMCDVTDIPEVAAGDEVVVIGSQGKERITAEEVAGIAGTISYEIFCNISARVPRRYV